jgi:hypothetical protein
VQPVGWLTVKLCVVARTLQAVWQDHKSSGRRLIQAEEDVFEIGLAEPDLGDSLIDRGRIVVEQNGRPRDRHVRDERALSVRSPFDAAIWNRVTDEAPADTGSKPEIGRSAALGHSSIAGPPFAERYALSKNTLGRHNRH